MLVETQTLINVAMAGIMSCIGWFARTLWDAVKELRSDLHKLEIDLPSHYIKKNEFLDSMKEIKDILNRMMDKLDEKADKL